MFKRVLLAMVLVLPLSATAAVSKDAAKPDQKELITSALRLPFENRLAALKAQGPETLKLLEALAFDPKQSLNTRWKSLTALGRLKGKAALSAMQKALASDEWFMRNAALLALPNVDSEVAESSAKDMLQDGALVIRTAAVDVLDQLRSPGARELMWRELYAERNYRGGQSLWIRRHIARTLSRHARDEEVARFAKLLKDDDIRLHPWAVIGLEKSTGRILGNSEDTWSSKRAMWLDQDITQKTF